MRVRLPPAFTIVDCLGINGFKHEKYAIDMRLCDQDRTKTSLMSLKLSLNFFNRLILFIILHVRPPASRAIKSRNSREIKGYCIKNFNQDLIF